MNQALLDKIESEQFRKDAADFGVGDTVRVHTKVVEGDKERIQVFSGVVIGRRGHGLNEMFTVRRISYGEGVERVFPLHSPRVEKVEVERKGSVRRAKLTYLRKRLGKGATLVKEKEGRVAAGATAAATTPAPAKPAAAPRWHPLASRRPRPDTPRRQQFSFWRSAAGPAAAGPNAASGISVFASRRAAAGPAALRQNENCCHAACLRPGSMAAGQSQRRLRRVALGSVPVPDNGAAVGQRQHQQHDAGEMLDPQKGSVAPFAMPQRDCPAQADEPETRAQGDARHARELARPIRCHPLACGGHEMGG